MSVEQLVTDSALRSSTRRSPLRRLLRDPQAIITAILVLAFIALGLLAPLISPHDPNGVSLQEANAAVGTRGYFLGADQSGRDILSRLLASAGTSIVSGAIGAGVALVIGVTAGLVGGYFGRRISAVAEWIFNLVMTFPGVLLLIVLYPITKGDYRVTMLIFGVMLSPNIFRIVKNLVVSVKQELYVDAARVSGLSNARILGRHVLVVVRGPVIIATAFLVSASVGIQSGLAFLGIGSNQVPSFGAMIGDGFANLYRAPLQFVWPSLALGILTASLVLFGNALRDALEGARPRPVRDPRAEQAAAAPVAGGMALRGAEPLLVIEHLAVAYRSPSGEPTEVVSDVSFVLESGVTMGLVGESGSGKTQTAFAILGVLPPEGAVVRGSIRLNGVELVRRSERELRTVRGREIAYIPQEPMSNLDPSFTVGSQLVEGVRATTSMSRREARAAVLALLERVGIRDTERVFSSYPHQISGGMAQRVLIAGAVASRPRLLIADEPTTALDVTVQAEILDLLRDLQAEMGMAVLFVTHNFGVVADICERVVVMRSGRVIESSAVRDLFEAPQEAYTRQLLDAILDDAVVRPPLRATSGAIR